MKRRIFRLILVAGVLATVHPVQARDTKYLLPIKAALEVKDAEEKLDGSVKFYFGNQETPKIVPSSAPTCPIARPTQWESPTKRPATGRFFRR